MPPITTIVASNNPRRAASPPLAFGCASLGGVSDDSDDGTGVHEPARGSVSCSNEAERTNGAIDANLPSHSANSQGNSVDSALVRSYPCWRISCRCKLGINMRAILRGTQNRPCIRRTNAQFYFSPALAKPTAARSAPGSSRAIRRQAPRTPRDGFYACICLRSSRKQGRALRGKHKDDQRQRPRRPRADLSPRFSSSKTHRNESSNRPGSPLPGRSRPAGERRSDSHRIGIPRTLPSFLVHRIRACPEFMIDRLPGALQ